VEATDIDGRTLMHVAIRSGQKNVADYLLSKNADINAKERFIGGFTPLHEAISSRHGIDLAQYLLDQGAMVDSQDEEGLTPLYRACTFYKCDYDVIRLLLEKGASIENKDKRGRTPLFRACLQNNLKLIELLLDHGAQIDSKDCEGCTALFRAVEQKNIESIRLLVDCGSDVLALSNDRQSPLTCAIETGCTDGLYWIIRSHPEIWEQISQL